MQTQRQTQRSTLIHFMCNPPLFCIIPFFYSVQFYLYSGIVVLHHAAVLQCYYSSYSSACDMMLLLWKSVHHNHLSLFSFILQLLRVTRI